MGLCRCLSGDTADSSGLPALTGNENSLIYRLLSPLNPLLEIKINMQLLFPSAPDISVKWQSIVRGCANEIPLQRRAGENLLGSRGCELPSRAGKLCRLRLRLGGCVLLPCAAGGTSTARKQSGITHSPNAKPAASIPVPGQAQRGSSRDATGWRCPRVFSSPG